MPDRVHPLTPLEAAAVRGLRARERALADRERALRAEAAAIRADLDAVVRHVADRLALEPRGYGGSYQFDADAGVVILAETADADDRPHHDAA